MEENKKARKVDVHMVRDYAEGQYYCTQCIVKYYCVYMLCSSEISAKYTETSAKTGYNIGEGSWHCVAP